MPYVILRRGQDLQEVLRRQSRPQPGLPLLGQTHLTPEQRFAKHKSGHGAGKYVFRYGLVPAMYDHINPVETRERAPSERIYAPGDT